MKQPQRVKGYREQSIRKSLQTELSIFRLIQVHPHTSRVELAARSGLSTAAITGVVNSLLARELIVEDRNGAGATGRRRISLMIRPGLACVAGIDLGTYNLRICLSDLNGSLLATREMHSDMFRGRDAVLASVFSSLRELLREVQLPDTSLEGIGIGFSGVIDSAHGRIISYPRPGQMEQWKDTPLREIAEGEFGVPVFLEDSVRTVAIEERLRGAGRDYENFVYVDVGVGVGAALYIDGKLYLGHGGGAGEFGHMTVDQQGPLCCCGNSGCLEAIASGAAILEAVRNAIGRGVSTQITRAAHYSYDYITLEMIAEAAANDDSLAYRVLIEAASHIGAAAASMINLLNPAAIIFGGALFRAAPDLLISRVRSAVRHRAMERSVSTLVLRTSTLDSSAGARGAARLAASQLVDRIYCSATAENPVKTAVRSMVSVSSA